MATITIASQTTEFEWSAATPPRLRIYAKVPFLTSAGVPVHAGNQYAGRAYRDVACTLDGSNRVVTPAVTLPSTTDSNKPDTAEYIAFLYSRGADLSSQFQEFSEFAAGFQLPDDPTSTTWEDIQAYNSEPQTLTPRSAEVTGTLHVGGNLTVDGVITGNGAGITGLTGATGGVANTGSTTIGADTDDNGVGVIDLQTRLQTRARVNNDGTFELFKPARLMGYATGSLPAGVARQLAFDTDRNVPVFYDGGEWRPVGGGTGFFNVVDYGATGDGSTDDTSAIQDCIDACAAAGGGIVFFPPGEYAVTGLTVADNYVRLQGCGWASCIAMSAATGNTLIFDNGITGNVTHENVDMLTGAGVENVRFEPSVNRTSGMEVVAYRYNKIYLNDLVIQATPGTANLLYMGMLLGRAADNQAITAYVHNLRMRQYKFGIKAVNAIEVWGTNWSLDKYDQTDDTYSIWLSGYTSGFNLSNFDVVNALVNTAETANDVYALYIHNDSGLTGAICLANLFSNGYFDSHVRGLYADDGKDCKFTNVWFSDRSTGAGVGIGVTVSGNADAFSFMNCGAMNNGGPGYYIGGAGKHSIIGGSVLANNQQNFANTDLFSAGIVLDQAAGGHTLVQGVIVKKDTLFGSNNQQWGIWITNSGGNFEVTNNYLSGNNTGAINNLAGLSTVRRIHHNTGFVTENAGNSAVANGTTSIAVSHGLAVTPDPAHVTITPTNNPTNNVRYWVSATSSTTFTVTTSADPGASGLSFGWTIKVQ